MVHRFCMLLGMWDLPRPGIEPVSPCIGRQIIIHCATREVLLPDLGQVA